MYVMKLNTVKLGNIGIYKDEMQKQNIELLF